MLLYNLVSLSDNVTRLKQSALMWAILQLSLYNESLFWNNVQNSSTTAICSIDWNSLHFRETLLHNWKQWSFIDKQCKKLKNMSLFLNFITKCFCIVHIHDLLHKGNYTILYYQYVLYILWYVTILKQYILLLYTGHEVRGH